MFKALQIATVAMFGLFMPFSVAWGVQACAKCSDDTIGLDEHWFSSTGALMSCNGDTPTCHSRHKYGICTSVHGPCAPEDAELEQIAGGMQEGNWELVRGVLNRYRDRVTYNTVGASLDFRCGGSLVARVPVPGNFDFRRLGIALPGRPAPVRPRP
jgi:hypothetical protein